MQKFFGKKVCSLFFCWLGLGGSFLLAKEEGKSDLNVPFEISYYFQKPQFPLFDPYLVSENASLHPPQASFCPSPGVDPTSIFEQIKLPEALIFFPTDLPQNVEVVGGFWKKITSVFREEAKLRHAVNLYFQGNKAAAIPLFLSLSQEKSSISSQARLWLAWSYSQKLNWPASVPHFQTLLEDQDPLIRKEAQYFLAWIAYQKGKWAEGLQILENPTGESLKSAKSLYLAFWLSIKLNQPKKAMALARRLEAAFPYSFVYPQFLEVFGDFLQKNGAYFEALKRYQYLENNFSRPMDSQGVRMKILLLLGVLDQKEALKKAYTAWESTLKFSAGERNFYLYLKALSQKNYPSAEVFFSNITEQSSFYFGAVLLAIQNPEMLKNNPDLWGNRLKFLLTKEKTKKSTPLFFTLGQGLAFLYCLQSQYHLIFPLLGKYYEQQPANKTQDASQAENLRVSLPHFERGKFIWMQAKQQPPPKNEPQAQKETQEDFSPYFPYFSWNYALKLRRLLEEQKWQAWETYFQQGKSQFFQPEEATNAAKEEEKIREEDFLFPQAQSLLQNPPSPSFTGIYAPDPQNYFWESVINFSKEKSGQGALKKIPLSFAQKREIDWMRAVVLLHFEKKQPALEKIQENVKTYPMDFHFSISLFQQNQDDESLQKMYKQELPPSLNKEQKDQAREIYIQSLLASGLEKKALEAMQNYPWSPPFQTIVSLRVQILQGKKEEAKAFFKGQKPTPLKNPKEAFLMGSLAYKVGEYSLANLYFLKAAELFQTQTEKGKASYNAFASQGKTDWTDNFWQEGRKILSTNFPPKVIYQTLTELANAYRWLKNDEEAQSLYQNYFQFVDFKKFAIGLYFLANLIENEQPQAAKVLIQGLQDELKNNQPNKEQVTEKEKIDFWLLFARNAEKKDESLQALSFLSTLFPEQPGKSKGEILPFSLGYKKKYLYLQRAELYLDQGQVAKAESDKKSAGFTGFSANAEGAYFQNFESYLLAYLQFKKGNALAWDVLLKNSASLRRIDKFPKVLKLSADAKFQQKKYKEASQLLAKSIFLSAKSNEDAEPNQDWEKLAEYLKAANFEQDAQNILQSRKNTPRKEKPDSSF